MLPGEHERAGRSVRELRTLLLNQQQTGSHLSSDGRVPPVPPVPPPSIKQWAPAEESVLREEESRDSRGNLGELYACAKLSREIIHAR